MRIKPKKLLAFFMAAVIVLLPFRFGHAFVQGEHKLDHAMIGHGIQECDHSDNSHASLHCSYQDHDAVALDECCGDQCSGAQVLNTRSLGLHFSSSQDFNHPCFKSMPEVFVFFRFRPPIAIS